MSVGYHVVTSGKGFGAPFFKGIFPELLAALQHTFLHPCFPVSKLCALDIFETPTTVSPPNKLLEAR